MIGIEGIDTRALVRLTRARGAMKGILSTTDLDDARLVAKAQASPGLVGRDLAREVMPERADRPGSRASRAAFVSNSGRRGRVGSPGRRARPHVVALDFGMKWNIPRHLVETGCRVTVVPGSTPAEAVLEHEPDGIFLSNGPGDPGAARRGDGDSATLIRTAAESRGMPIFGICLGHQLLGQAFGARTFKLKFGHRGANHPVRNEQPARSRSPPRTTASPSTPTPFRPTSRPATSTSTTRRSKGSGTPACPSSASSTTPRPRPARTTASTCSPSSAR